MKDSPEAPKTPMSFEEAVEYFRVLQKISPTRYQYAKFKVLEILDKIPRGYDKDIDPDKILIEVEHLKDNE